MQAGTLLIDVHMNNYYNYYIQNLTKAVVVAIHDIVQW